MEASATGGGINMGSLREAFEGSEDVLVQMLGLFKTQAAERIAMLRLHMDAADDAATRVVLHSLVNIAGAVRAYGMSELARQMGEAIKRGDRPQAVSTGALLEEETAAVLAQVGGLLNAGRASAANLWNATPQG